MINTLLLLKMSSPSSANKRQHRIKYLNRNYKVDLKSPENYVWIYGNLCFLTAAIKCIISEGTDEI